MLAIKRSAILTYLISNTIERAATAPNSSDKLTVFVPDERNQIGFSNVKLGTDVWL